MYKGSNSEKKNRVVSDNSLILHYSRDFSNESQKRQMDDTLQSQKEKRNYLCIQMMSDR